MSFLQWLAGKQEEPEESQLDIFGGSQGLTKRERVDGAVVNKDFNQEIKNKGGSERTYPRATEALAEELFDVGSKELYKATEGKRNDRSTLPKEAQKAFIVGEIVATHDLRDKEIQGNQQQRDSQIVESVRDSGKKARGLFPW